MSTRSSKLGELAVCARRSYHSATSTHFGPSSSAASRACWSSLRMLVESKPASAPRHCNHRARLRSKVVGRGSRPPLLPRGAAHDLERLQARHARGGRRAASERCRGQAATLRESRGDREGRRNAESEAVFGRGRAFGQNAVVSARKLVACRTLAAAGRFQPSRERKTCTRRARHDASTAERP